MAREEKGTGAGTAIEPVVPVHEAIEYRYNMHGTGPAVYTDTLRLKGRRPGKQVTEQEYLEAVTAFRERPMVGAGGTR